MMGPTEMLLAPLLDYGFMRIGLATALVVGVTAAVLSCLLVVRGQALLGDAISHAVLLGVVIGYLVAGTTGILAGALVVAMSTGAGISYLTRNAPFRSDTSMGVLFTAAFALGLAIISSVRPTGIDLFHVLFGNVLGVAPADLVLTAVTGGVVVGVVLIGFRAFELWSFDPSLAQAMGMRVGAMDYTFTALLSAAIVAALQTVGIVLVVAMLVTPGATAALFTKRLSTMMWAAAVAGLLSGAIGLYGSFHLDVASGPSIVLAASGLFVLVWLFSPTRGILVGAVRRTRHRRGRAADAIAARGGSGEP